MSRQKKFDQEFTEAFARRLKLELSKAKMSGREVAKALEVSPETVRRWCNAISMPDSHDLALLSERYNLSADYLLHGTRKMVDSNDLSTNKEDSRKAIETNREKARVEELEMMLNHYLEVLDGYKTIIDNLKSRISTLEDFIRVHLPDDEQAAKLVGGTRSNP